MTSTEETQTLLPDSFSPKSSQSRSPYGSLDSTREDVIASTIDSNIAKVDHNDGSTSPSHRSLLLESDGHDMRTQYERKCDLVDQEIENLGMGKYQWHLWSLCGLGYMIDLLWAQAFGLVLSPMQQELGFGDDETGNLSTAFSAGLTVGALVWGILVDVIGRRWAFNLTVFISSIFGLCLGFPDGYTSILVLTACVGFGVGGNIPIDTTITLEFTPQNRRYLLPLLSIFQPIGVVICSAIAYGFIPNYSCSPNFSEANPLSACSTVSAGEPCCSKADNMGWRYLLYTLGSITLLVFCMRFVVFQFQESPKFLLYRGRDADAVKVLQHVAKMNRRASSLTMEKLEAVEDEWEAVQSGRGRPGLGDGVMLFRTPTKQRLVLELARFKLLFSDFYMTRVTLLTWLIYICDYSGFTVAGTYSSSNPFTISRIPLIVTRLLPPTDSRGEEWRTQSLPPLHLRLLHHDLHSRRPRCSLGRTPLSRPLALPQTLHDALRPPHVPLHLRLQHNKHCCIEHRAQRAGVLLPKYV
jgi:MFS family permease